MVWDPLTAIVNIYTYIYIWGNTFVELVISWFGTIREIYENWKIPRIKINCIFMDPLTAIVNIYTYIWGNTFVELVILKINVMHEELVI